MDQSNLNNIHTDLNPEKSSREVYYTGRERDYNRSPEEQKLIEEIENLKSDREMRREYAEKAYGFAKYTILFWVSLFFVYFLGPSNNKPLSDTALGIFTTACTVNILAAFISIIKGLFPSSK